MLYSPESALQLKGIFLHVTKACNLACTYCYFSAARALPDELTADEYVTLWPEIVAMKIPKVIFTGGEPLLRDDLIDLLAGLRSADPQHSVLRCLNTNGHVLSERISRRMVGLVDEVRVSLDALRERNDALRGEGNYDAAIRALDILQSVGFEPKVLVTVTSASLPDLEELLALLARRGIRRINLNGLRMIGRARAYRELRAESDMTKPVLDRIRRILSNSEVTLDEPSVDGGQAHCGVGGLINVMPNGDVYPCHELVFREFRCGNIRRQRLSDILLPTGLLGKLAELNFLQLAGKDERLRELARPGSCMGSVYRLTKDSAAWSRELPLVQIEGPATKHK